MRRARFGPQALCLTPVPLWIDADVLSNINTTFPFSDQIKMVPQKKERKSVGSVVSSS